MGRTTSCIAKTCASWPSCSSTTRPSTSTLSLSFSTFSARWTGSGCLETLEQLEPWHSSDMATTLWGTFPKRKKALMETMLLVFSPCPHTRFNAFSNYSLRLLIFSLIPLKLHLYLFQRKGYGKLLIAFSYELSKMEQVATSSQHRSFLNC